MAVKSGERQPRLEPRVGLAFGEGELHVICDGGGGVSSGRKAEALGKGGAGSVYACVYGTHRQRRAVKFLTLNKLDAEREGRRAADFEKTFANERAVLSQLSHSNISVFHEDGVHLDEKGNAWHYLVTDHVSGPELKEALSDPAMSGEDIHLTLSNLFEAVAYLHRHGVYHCDIKAANIRMRGKGSSPGEVVLLDWGAAQVLNDAHAPALVTTLNFPTESNELRQFVSTDYITHERHKLHLKARLTSQDLWMFVPSHELHTLGVLLRDTTSLDEEWSASVRERLSRAIGSQGMSVLDDIIDDLMRAPDGQGYGSVEELVSDFAKLHRNYLAPAGVPELGLATEFQYSVPTATGRAVMTPRFAALASHRLVNRLHDVHQLESTYLKFPGATHTRKSHSLSVLHNTRYYISHLLNDSRFRRVAERHELEAALLLALLHDIGHYQLSHMFEDLATDQVMHRGADPWTGIGFDIPTDDTLFGSVLGMPDEQVVTPLRGGYTSLLQDLARGTHERARLIAAEDEYQTLAELISSRFGEDTLSTLASLHSIIYGKRRAESPPTPAQRVLAAIISSDIDADKTAYLVEDSQNTGVPYGSGVDLDGILGNLCMPTAADLDKPGFGPLIGLRSAGIQAAQSVAVNRNQMLSQVYWNASNRAVTVMVKYVLMRLLAADKFDMSAYLAVAIFGGRNECMQWLAAQFDEAFGDREINPIVGVIDGANLVYERVCEVRSGLVEDAGSLNEKLIAMTSTELLTLQDAIAKALGNVPGLARLSPGELLVDVPSKERAKPAGDRGGKVYVYDRYQSVGAGKPLDEASPLYDGLKKQHRDLNRVSRVYITPRRFAGLSQRVREECARVSVETMQDETGM